MFFQIGDLFAEGVVVVPTVRRARQGQAIGYQPFDQQFEYDMRRFLEGAMHAAMVAQAGFLDQLGAFLEPVPGVFFVLADIFLEDDAQKKLHGLEAGFVHVRQRRQHGADLHVQCP